MLLLLLFKGKEMRVNHCLCTFISWSIYSSAGKLGSSESTLLLFFERENEKYW